MPWLLEHGPLFWKAAAVASGILAVALVFGTRYAILRFRHRNAGRSIRDDRSAVRGVLRGDLGALASTITAETWDISSRPTTRFASWRAPKVWLETAGRTIALRGPLHVVAGSRFVARRRELPPGEDIEAVVREQLWTGAYLRSAVVQSLRAGDEVAVCGQPQPEAGQSEAFGREANIAWALEGGEEAPLELAAFRPVAPRLPIGLLPIAIVFGLGLGGALIAEEALGDRWEEECSALRWRSLAPDDPEAAAPIAVTNDHVCVLAASTRADPESAWGLLRLLETHPYRDAATDELILSLSRTMRTCDQRVESLYEANRFEAALAEARLCNDRRYQHLSLVELGRIEEALAISVKDRHGELPTLATLIAGKRWSDAVHRVDHPDFCLEQMLRHRTGDPEAIDRLREISPTPDGLDVCGRVLVALDPTAVRANDSLERDLFEATHAFDSVLINADSASQLASWVWLPIENDTVRLRQQATLAAFRNDDAGARNYAELAAGPASELAKRIALYSDEVFAMEPFELAYGRDERLYLRTSQRLPNLELGRITPQGKLLDEAKRTGDARILMELVRSGELADVDLLALLPHLTKHRDVLARELPFFPSRRGGRDDLFAIALRAVVRRELFEQLGRTDEAARWDAVFRRFDRVFEDRDVALALSLLD